MGRWDPGAEQRLRNAALELYFERGFDNVTVTEIAERAGLTRRSFFRYFADKRDVLFAGSERLPAAIEEAIDAVDDSVDPASAVFEAFADVGGTLLEGIDGLAQRRAIIAASEELQERERTKMAAVTSAVADALVKRHVEPRSARLLAQTCTIVLQDAFARSVEPGEERDFRTLLSEGADTLRAGLGASLW